MFGYVNVYKDELKIKDYNIYRAYYCGLCKLLGKRHNQLARLSLNYDLTFLAIVTDSLSDRTTEFEVSGCVKKLGKRKLVSEADGLEFAADMNVLLTYFKLKDDIADNHSVKALISIIPFALRIRKIRRLYPELFEVVSESLSRLSYLEDTRCCVLDQVANEFAVIMQAILKTANPVLETFGYILGRLIYIMDAYDDMVEDYKHKRYNPASSQYEYSGKMTSEIKERMKNNLYYTLAALADEYKNLPVKKNKIIIDNIIYLGLRAGCDAIIDERKSRNEKSL